MAIDPTNLFRALADETRLRCLALLVAEGELCVCELTHALGLSQPMISRHLASLREAGIVSDRRAGQWIHYRLHNELPKWAQRVLTEALAGITRSEPYRADQRALHAMSNRPSNRCA
jgi:ArsR family transcriptional regulator